MDGPNRDERTLDDGRTRRQPRRQVTETDEDGDGASRQGRATTQGDRASAQNQTKTNGDGDNRTMNSGAAREQPKGQRNKSRSDWNRRTIAGMVGLQP